MNAIEYIDADEGRETTTSNACYNCGAKSSNGTSLTPVALDDAILDNAWGCDDCIAEQKGVEAEAEQLAALPSCGLRQRIVDQPDLTAQRLVGLLTVHDWECADCAPKRVMAATDRLHAASACCGVA